MSRLRYVRPVYWLVCLLILTPMLTFAGAPTVSAAPILPPGFVDELVTSVGAPTALAFTPDERMLVARQTGQLMVYRDGALLATALDLTVGDRVCTNSERGLLGMAVDPAFASNRFVYLYYTYKKHGTCPTGQPASNPVNRVSRFTLADSNTIDLGGELVLLDNMPSPNGNHNGGDLNFGKDGFLYVSIGEGGVAAAAQQLNILSGKILRITRDGAIPASNPYQEAGTARCNVNGPIASGICQEIYASGLRNPYRFGFDPNVAETRFFINDVGASTWEEIDEGQAGANYGWPTCEGFCAGGTPPGLTNPIFAYGRDGGCGTITGGAFVPAGVWPAEYAGAYIFADFLCGKLFALRQGPGGWTATEFVTGLGFGTVHLRFGPPSDPQALYYTTYGSGGQVRRITQRFTDVPAEHPAYQAVEELRVRGLVKGYGTVGCAAQGLAHPCFGPGDTSLRAQMAVMIVRGMGWSGEQATNPFTDQGGLDAELWNAVAILAARGVAEGYGDGRFGPNDTVSQAQLASFVARAMIDRGFWTPAAQDDPSIYPNVPDSTGHRLDLVTYVQNAGALPDYPSSATWATWNAPATREWFARVLWQALETVGP